MRSLVLLLLLAAVAAGGLAAQVPLDLCRPPLVSGPTPVAELGATAFGVAAVAQLAVVPDGSGGFEGIATVRPIGGSTGFDLVDFTWAGPGTWPVVTAAANALNGPDDEFQGSLDRSRLAILFDSGPSHPIGAGDACIASRAGLGGAFGSIQPLVGVPAGPIDPALGRIAGTAVVYFVTAPDTIAVGDIDIDPVSPAYGHVTNVRDAVVAGTIGGLVTLHSPAPQFDAAGDTVGLALAAWIAGTGSDAWYQSAAECAAFPLAAAAGRLLFALDEHGADWLGNPLVARGTAIYAHGLGNGYLDPERYDYFPLTSASVPQTGGIAHFVAQLPLGESAPFAGVLELGVRMATPLDPRLLGFPGAGLLCVTPILTSPAGLFAGGELAFDLPVPAVAPGAVLDAQCLSVDPLSGRVWMSNAAVLEVRP